MNILEMKQVKSLEPGQTKAVAQPGKDGQLMANRSKDKDGRTLTIYRQLTTGGIELISVVKFPA
jgi:hypothetical protein